MSPSMPPRTKVSHLNRITYDSGRAYLTFDPPGSKFLGSQTVPPDNKWSDGSRSFMAPMSHFHLLQTETFHVASGSGLWYLASNPPKRLNAGDEIIIPRCISHTFENLPGSTEELVILWRYDAQMYKMEERFFRNILTYFEDCRVNKVEVSLLQVCLFLSAAWMPPNILWVPGWMGEYGKCAVNTVFMWVLAGVGWAVGYRVSYGEYYDPERGGRKGR